MKITITIMDREYAQLIELENNGICMHIDEFHETYKAYDVLSKQFDFGTSIRIYGKPIAGKVDNMNQTNN